MTNETFEVYHAPNMTNPQIRSIERDEDDWEPIASIYGSGPDAEAVAKLFAAAPRLLDGLRAIRERSLTLDDGVESDSPADTQIAAIWEMAGKALLTFGG